MITEEKLAELRNTILCDVHETTWLEIMDTLSALWRVARALEDVLNHGLEYENGQIHEANVEEAKASLAALREGKEKVDDYSRC